jgi:DNA polymerase III subunit alpha
MAAPLTFAKYSTIASPTMTQLHCHSHYSLLAGASSPAELVARAAELGIGTLALTDLNALHGCVEFQKACAGAGLRALHGVELTADPSQPQSGEGTPHRLLAGSLQPGRPRAVLLARDQAGYAAICRLTTLRQVQPAFDLGRELPGFLEREGHGVFCLTDSLDLLAALVRAAGGAADGHANGSDAPPDLVGATCGSLRVLLPVSGADSGPVLKQLRRLAAWAEAHDIPVCAGGDVWMARAQDRDRQKLLSAIRMRSHVDRIPQHQCAPAGSWLRPPAQVQELLSDFPTACREAEALADQCRFAHQLGRWRYPEFPLPVGETPISYLWKLCFDGLQKRYRTVASAAMSRLQEEIAVTEALGFAGYFLIVWDIVRWAAEQGMPSLGRGSAANSLISYLLGITHVDPLQHDLYFQRFLNPERLSPPDIDLDFGWKDRDRVLAYVTDRYGRDHTAMICNINRFSARAGFRESARARGHGDQELNQITRRFPWKLLDDPERSLARRPESRDLPLNREPWRSLLLQAQDLAQRPRHLGIHAGGVVITDHPLTDLFPLQWARKGILVSQLDMYSIEDLGLVKIDLLSQRGLAVVADAAQAVRDHHGVAVDLSRLPDQDPAARRLMREGETMGCFYVESPGMRSLLRRLRADTFAVVVAASSVIRPGPADSGMGRSYVLRHLGREEPRLPHPALGFLAETYGVMIYQEDVMRTLHAVAGMSLAEADLTRRAMSFKGDPGEFLALRDRFLDGARASMRAGRTPRVDDEVLLELWRQLASFAGYAFCKAHSASYAVLSWQAAWLKAHWPAEFMAAVLSNHGGFYSTAAYLEEARRLRLEILLPDINHSEADFTGRDRQVRIGLQQVRNLSRRSIDALVEARREHGFFVSLGDLLQRVPPLTETETEHLIRCGACDGFELTRPELLWRHALLRRRRRGAGAPDRRPALPTTDGATGTLFAPGAAGLGAGGGATALIPAIPDYSPAEKLQQELELLSLTATGHPLAGLRDHLRRLGAVPCAEVAGWVGRRIRVAGQVITAKTTVVKRSGEPMKFMTLEDETGLVEITLFPQVYAAYGGRLLSRGPYLVQGLVEDDHGAVSVTAESLVLI